MTHPPSFMMGYLIPWNINAMSIFSLTLKLSEDGDYTHPGYQMDDIIALIRWPYGITATYCGELYEWARQIRRWIIGAAEVFHYFAIKFFHLPVTVLFSFALKFVFYYGFLLCIAFVYSAIAPYVTAAMLNRIKGKVDNVVIPREGVFSYIVLFMLGLQYFWFACVFWINHACEKVFPMGRKDETGWIRSFSHWILAWPTITGYCFVELVSFLEVTVRGKSVCSHNASNKDALVRSSLPDQMEA